uniref:Large ribosomal subunit protein uL22c n=1 Tax=Nitzschia sp. PL3-2 TaxID=2083271 RepID=A0A2Z5ZAD9_9STRA|nr:hypothetical protein orf117 [Nitzschia sp. PL3-2]
MSTYLTTKATAKHIHMSPHKVRRVINQIRNCSYKKSLMILKFLPYKASKPVYKLIESAAANAVFLNNLKKDELYVYKIFVNEGPKLKRNRIQSRGRISQILKPTCHITVILKVYKKK